MWFSCITGAFAVGTHISLRLVSKYEIINFGAEALQLPPNHTIIIIIFNNNNNNNNLFNQDTSQAEAKSLRDKAHKSVTKIILENTSDKFVSPAIA